MGLKSCRKGKSYERAIAAELRARFPGADVRRSSQADRAGNSDVVVTGHPVLERCWLELTDAALPADLGADTGPLRKLAQAERDVAAAGSERWPVVVWHRKGEAGSWVTLRLGTLTSVCGQRLPVARCGYGAVVTLALADFLDLA